MERDTAEQMLDFLHTNFNSHAHVERDRLCKKQQFLERISTHTLTWSVTVVASVVSDGTIISTHTLTWSVTFCAAFAATYALNFNSHAHVERDL